MFPPRQFIAHVLSSLGRTLMRMYPSHSHQMVSPGIPQLLADLKHNLIEDIEVKQKLLTFIQSEFGQTSMSQSGEMLHLVCKLVDQLLFLMVEWARSCTFFKEMKVEDQMKLLQNCRSEILILDLVHRHVHQSWGSEVILSNGQKISLDLLDDFGLSDIKGRMLELMKKFKDLQIDANEYLCLKFLILLNPEREAEQDGRGDFWNKMLGLHQDPAFSDLTLILGPTGVAVHTSQLLVASLSDVFRHILEHDMVERRERIIRLQAITVDAWNSILSFFLRVQKSVDEEEVENLIALADMYELLPFKKYCESVWIKQLCPDNCIRMFEFAGLYCEEATTGKIVEYLRDNFEDVSKTEGFLNLNQNRFLETLQGPYIVTTEDSLCTSILAWMGRHDVNEDTASDLLRRLRLNDLSQDCLLKQLMYHPRVVLDKAFRESLTQEIQRRMWPQSSAATPTAPYRRMLKEEDGVLVVGQINKEIRVFYSDRSMQQWETLPTVQGTSGIAACIFDGALYVAGGSPDSMKTYIFHLERWAWTQGPDLLIGRGCHGMVAIDDSVYVVMGVSGTSYCKCIEALSRTNRRWRRVGKMLVSLYFCGVSNIRDTIIAAGVTIQTGLNILQTYNVRTGTPAILNSPMRRSPQFLQATNTRDRAFFLGVNGLLIIVCHQDNEELLVTHKQLRFFDVRVRPRYGILVNGYLTIISTPVVSCPPFPLRSCYTMDGEPIDAEEPSLLPSPVEIYGAFRFFLPQHGVRNGAE